MNIPDYQKIFETIQKKISRLDVLVDMSKDNNDFYVDSYRLKTISEIRELYLLIQQYELAVVDILDPHKKNYVKDLRPKVQYQNEIT